MKKFGYFKLIILAVTVAFSINAFLKVIYPIGTEKNDDGWGKISPRVGSFADYIYTIGTTFNRPSAVAMNNTGHVYVADTWNHRVRVFDSAGTYQYTIGETGVSGSDNAHFNYPGDVAINTTGHLYVVDQYNNRVQVFDNAGTYQYTIGETGVSGSDNAHFSFPTGVEVNSTGHLYVADQSNFRVQVFDNAGIYQYTIGTTGASGADNNHFYWPTAVAVNNTGHVYVADTWNHRVQVFDSTGAYKYTIGTTGVSGADNTHFNYTLGVAMNVTGHLFVADGDNHRVQVFDNAGTYQYTIGTTGASGADNNHFNNPAGVAVNSTGYLYVADRSNHRVQVFSNGTAINLTLAINGGAINTGSTSVTLTLSAHDALEMCFSNNGTAFTAWEVYGTSKAWMLDGGPGSKIVYFKARNANGESGPVSTSITYIMPPTGLTITINGGASETGSKSVTLTLAATNATEMCFSNDSTTWSAWEPYATTKPWVLAGGAGPNTVHFKVRNGTIEAVATVMDTITYTFPPTGLSITIEGGVLETTSTSVTLTISATDATEMCFSNDGVTWSVWEPYATTKPWTLAGGAGPNTVHFKARNGTIEAMAPATDTIIFTPNGGIPGAPIGIVLLLIGLTTFYMMKRNRLARTF